MKKLRTVEDELSYFATMIEYETNFSKIPNYQSIIIQEKIDQLHSAACGLYDIIKQYPKQ